MQLHHSNTQTFKKSESKDSEETTLFAELSAGYGSDSHATFMPKDSEHQALTDYQPLKLSTFRIFCLQRGTILGNPILLMEQLLISVVFFSMALPVYIYFKSDATEDVSLRRFLRQQEGKMRAFAMIMTGLAAFLLSFYTSITVGRWWTMRTAGVGAIKAATVDLQLLLRQCVLTGGTKEDDTILDAVQRYGRASLQLVFLWRQQELAKGGDHFKSLVGPKGHNLLTEDECDKLLNKDGVPKHCLHETIWAWQIAVVSKLKGKIQSDQLQRLLLEKCMEGRAAAQCIHTHLAVRVPMQYVHLLGFLVKMHNLVLSVIMGLLFGAALRNGYIILCVQLFARTLILPFLFNAILLINCDLADPFNGGEIDFPGDIYVGNLGKDCAGMQDLTTNLPTWLKEP